MGGTEETEESSKARSLTSVAERLAVLSPVLLCACQQGLQVFTSAWQQ